MRARHSDTDRPGGLVRGGDRRDELRALIARHAHNQGHTASPLPGLRFNRADRASVHVPSCVPALALTVVVQGKKVCRIGDRDIHYDADTYLVFTGETQFTSTCHVYGIFPRPGLVHAPMPIASVAAAQT